MQITTIEQAAKALGLNEYSKVRNFCEAFLKQNPDHKLATYLLAGSLWGLDKFADALDIVNKILKLEPGNPKYLQLRGIIYKSLNEYEKAITDLEKSLQIEPNAPDTQNSMGATLAMAGDEAAAVSYYKKAIELNSKFEVSWNALAKTRNYEFSKQEINLLKSFLNEQGLTPQQEYLFNNTLGLIYDKRHEYATAFKYFKAANTIAGVKTDINGLCKQLQNCIDFFNSDFSSTSKLVGRADITPIFIVGMPRSGTTLTEQIIATYANVKACGERNTLNKQINDFATESKTISANKSGPIAINIAVPAPYPQNLAKLTQEKLDIWISEYLEPLAWAQKQNKNIEYITDKMPFNYRFIPVILLMFPNAKIIHCMRNAVDTCLSCYMQPFAKTMLTFTNDFKTLGAYYNNYSALMQHYNEIFPNKIYNLEYENLTENSEIEAKKLIQYCGLDWTPKCLEFYNNKTNKLATASQWQVRNPIYKSSVNKSEHYKEFLSELLISLQVV